MAVRIVSLVSVLLHALRAPICDHLPPVRPLEMPQALDTAIVCALGSAALAAAAARRTALCRNMVAASACAVKSARGLLRCGLDA